MKDVDRIRALQRLFRYLPWVVTGLFLLGFAVTALYAYLGVYHET